MIGLLYKIYFFNKNFTNDCWPTLTIVVLTCFVEKLLLSCELESAWLNVNDKPAKIKTGTTNIKNGETEVDKFFMINFLLMIKDSAKI